MNFFRREKTITETVCKECGMEFSGSRLCTVREVLGTTNLPAGLTGSARTSDNPDFPYEDGDYCFNWTN